MAKQQVDVPNGTLVDTPLENFIPLSRGFLFYSSVTR